MSVMESKNGQNVTLLLKAWSQGQNDALEKLLPLVYSELHRLAHHFMNGERSGHLLQTTALINEAFLRLVDTREAHPTNRAHFFALSAQMMRRILVDYARSQHCQKRGGDMIPLTLEEACMLPNEPDANLVALDEALFALSEFDLRKSQVVELRYFGGLSVEETAAVLNLSPDTVLRDWQFAKAWLLRHLRRGNDQRDSKAKVAGFEI